MGSLARVPPLSKGTPLSCHKFEQPVRNRSDVPRVGSPALSDGDPVISKTGFGSTRQRAQRDLGHPFELRTARPTRRLDRHTFQHR
jgi:hypothetical protein